MGHDGKDGGVSELDHGLGCRDTLVRDASTGCQDTLTRSHGVGYRDNLQQRGGGYGISG